MSDSKSTKRKPDSTVDPYKLYEQGLEKLHSGDYEAARELMDAIEGAAPDEIDVLGRARSVRAVCIGRMESQEQPNHKPTTAEEWYDYGILLHNEGSYEDALEHFRRALKLANEDLDFVHYAIAATTARQNDGSQAIEHLKKAIALRPESRFVAAHDPDFSSLRNDSTFQAVLGLTQ
ncbi:MAG: tetratricopeptide repeat protein [Acidobacteriota bacterium]|jgi:tetratricopeptide (TPR) repeat protein